MQTANQVQQRPTKLSSCCHPRKHCGKPIAPSRRKPCLNRKVRHFLYGGDAGRTDRSLARTNVRYWHLADIQLAPQYPLLGVKRTWRFALHMSAFDPKPTLGTNFQATSSQISDGDLASSSCKPSQNQLPRRVARIGALSGRQKGESHGTRPRYFSNRLSGSNYCDGIRCVDRVQESFVSQVRMLLVQSGHHQVHSTCPLLGQERTIAQTYRQSEFQPKHICPLATARPQSVITAREFSSPILRSLRA